MLRFDKVAIGLIDRIEAAVRAEIPAGTTVAFTLTAPIRSDSKTGMAVEEKIRAVLARRGKATDVTASIFENRVRIRLIKPASNGAPKVLGFVHNPDADSRLILDVAQAILARKLR